MIELLTSPVIVPTWAFVVLCVATSSLVFALGFLVILCRFDPKEDEK
tara:strand:- start:3343 stop:3483 length:141 start_codon:yes stop_codon:yes gene_type:complete